MADSQGIRAGRAFIELSVSDKFTKQIDAAAKKLKDVGQSITDLGKRTLAIGAAITAPLLIAAQRFAAMGEEIAKASAKTGVSAETLTALKYAADQAGVGFDQLENGVGKMQKTLYAAATGSKEAREALAAIGLSIEDLKNLSPDQQFQKIAAAIASIQDPTARTGAAMAIFGRSGAELLPLLSQGAEGIAAMEQHARDLGITMSTEDANAGLKFAQVMKDLWAQVQMVTFHIGHAVATALFPFAEAATKTLRTVIDWTKAHQPLIIAALTAGVAISALGAGILTLGLSLKAAGVALSGITSGIKFAGSVIGLLANPVVITGAALIGLVGILIYATGNGGKLLTWLGGKFRELAATANETFSGLADALAAGDMALAAQILWAGLKLAWLEGMQELQNRWIDFKAGFVRVAAAAFYGVREIWANVSADLQGAFQKTVSFFGDVWDGFIGSFTNAWNSAVGAVAKGINNLHHLWDSKFDAKSANNAIDSENIEANNARQKKEMEDKQQRDAERERQIADIERQRQATVDQLNRGEQGISAGAGANADQEKTELQKKKEQLEAQLKEMRRQAAKEKSGKSSEAFPLIDPAKMKGLDDVAAQKATANLQSVGLFNVAAIQSLQSSPTQDAIRKAAEQTAKNTQKLVDRQNGFT